MRYRGPVHVGSQRARALGFPTINLDVKDAAFSGVYVGRVFYKGTEYPAAVFADPKRELLEAYMPGVTEEWYGYEVEVEVLQKIRDTQVFDEDGKLKAAIAADVAKVQEYFKN